MTYLESDSIRLNRKPSVTPAEVPGSTEQLSLEREEARHGGCWHFGRHDEYLIDPDSKSLNQAYS
jgi:hypothetical protein